MKSYLLDESGDIVIRNGQFVFVEGDEELAQQVRLSLQTEKGEWFLDLEEGMDYTPIFSKQFNDTEARDAMLEAISDVSEPLLAEEISFVRDTKARKMEIKPILRKENGDELDLEGVEI